MSSVNYLSVLCTGAGGASGFAALEALLGAEERLRLFAADCNATAAGFSIPTVRRVSLPSAAVSPESYRNELLTYCLNHEIDVVFPAPEAEVEALTGLRDCWRSAYGIELAVTPPDTALMGVDKYELYKRVSEDCPIKATEFLEITNAQDISKWEFGFPCVIKPKKGSNSKGVFVAKSMEELVICYEFMALHLEVRSSVIQAYIPGDVDATFTIGSLFWEGEFVTASIHQKLRTMANFGGSTVCAKISDRTDLIEHSIACLQSLGDWHGFVALETKVSANDNKPYLLEINPRLWGFAGLAMNAGINYPELYLKKLRGQRLSPPDLHFRKHDDHLVMIRSLQLQRHNLD